MTEIVSTKSYFWKEVSKNPLKGVVYISKTSHLYLRLLGLLITTASSIWVTIWAIDQHDPTILFSYMTIWGVWACNAYFLLVFIAADAPDHKVIWKISYMIGEIAACMEFCICPFFWCILFPRILPITTSFLILNVFLHLLCALCIFAEILVNHFMFPTSHRVVLIIVSICYMINNIAWTFGTGTPVYPVITWVNFMTYVYVLIAFVMVFSGFELGRYLYRKKLPHIKRSEAAFLDYNEEETPGAAD